MFVSRILGGFMVTALAVTASACANSSDENGSATHTSSATSSPSSGPLRETQTPLQQHPMPNAKGKTFTSITVDFPPGATAAPHRHGQAFVFAYVLEGSVRSNVDNGPTTTFQKGESWIEKPGAHHVLTENTSDSKPAKLLVTFVADTGAELKTDDAHH